MITFKEVTYRYPHQSTLALDNVNLCVEDGGFLLITGPSGSGKSTLARCANGLVPHFHGGVFGGQVLVNGMDTTRLSTSALSRQVGFVAQIPESQTVTDRVEDEIAFGVENIGLERREMHVRVEETLDLLGLNGLRRRAIETLSGGERQRVVIAAAMAMRPSVLVLDEPTSQLDPASSEEILSTLQRMNDELGTTILLVEHRLERVLGMSDRLLLLDECGQVVANGPVLTVLEHLAHQPPLLQIAKPLGWDPPPLTVREARRHAAASQLTHDARSQRPARRVPDSRPSVEFNDVTFAYDREPVLNRLSLAFHPGSLTALMGRNGSGKTTLLKLVNGLLRPSTGRVSVSGKDIARTQTTELAGDVGYLPQNAATMLFNESVADELRFTLRCQRKDTGDVDGTLERFAIADLALRNPLDLSGGERLRAALAAVLIGQPKILLLDEPTRGIDVHMKARLGHILRELADEGMTVLLATHDVDLVAEFADRVVLLGGGEAIADGTPQDVMAGSMTYSTQINRVFGGRLLTVDDVIHALD